MQTISMFRAGSQGRARRPSGEQPGPPGTRFVSQPTMVDLAWRTAYRIGFPLARVWWQFRRPSHEGALVAIHVGAALLVLRSSYRSTWNLPGGGIRTGESPEAAATRELAEELGLPAMPLTSAGIFSGMAEGRRDKVHLFEARLDRLPALRLDGREIILAELVALADLRCMALTEPVAAYVRGELATPITPRDHGTR